jgi:host factor-I protein
MGKSINLQDMFLNQCRKEGVQVTVYLTNSVQLRGLVKGFDAFTVLLDAPAKATQLVYKHAIASIVPQRPISTHREHDGNHHDHHDRDRDREREDSDE